ncbi:EF-hand domain-containing protein [Kitasatospora sp. NBC_01287]|uniref:EF-hand domain-containing protein n=1 Tax=Kitasatospora sp. NBC_01287 TaxID=2903573 RepID=UPI0022544F0D|nr:EF-hand domain-containing protein [Kitasatospora sp. NBC_01287]MCX4751189.1 EF-hand domain-containing protein [Kitasatospora sp. NBC_01287]
MSDYKVRTLELFDRLDVDRSGYINASDLTGAAAGRSVLITGIIEAADANKDGKVSREEMLNHVERAMVGRSPDTLPEYLRKFTAGAFTLMDADRTGTVSKAEFEQYLKARNTPAADEFAWLDRDRDGSITLDDLHIAAFTFFNSPIDCPRNWLLAAASA